MSKSDSGDYTYPAVRFASGKAATLPPLTGPERIDQRMEELAQAIDRLTVMVSALTQALHALHDDGR